LSEAYSDDKPRKVSLLFAVRDDALLELVYSTFRHFVLGVQQPGTQLLDDLHDLLQNLTALGEG